VTRTAQVTVCPVVSTKIPKAVIKKVLGPTATIYISRTILSDCTKTKTTTEKVTVTYTTTILRYADFMTVNRISPPSIAPIIEQEATRTTETNSFSFTLSDRNSSDRILTDEGTITNNNVETNMRSDIPQTLQYQEMNGESNSTFKNSCSTFIVCPAERFSCPNQFKEFQEIKAIIESPDKQSHKPKRNMNGAFID